MIRPLRRNKTWTLTKSTEGFDGKEVIDYKLIY